MSSLLGSTGNHPDYESYLESLGRQKKVMQSSQHPAIVRLPIWITQIWHMSGNSVD